KGFSQARHWPPVTYKIGLPKGNSPPPTTSSPPLEGTNGNPRSKRPAHIQDFSPPILADGVAVQIAELAEGLGDRLPGGRNGGRRIAVGAAGRLVEDAGGDAGFYPGPGRDLPVGLPLVG